MANQQPVMTLSRGESVVPAGGASVQILQIQGRLTFEEVDSLQRMFKQMGKEGAGEVIVDLTSCTYVDSAGLATLVHALRRARKRKQRFVLVGVSPQVRSLLRLTRLDRVFETQPTLDEVLVN